MVRRLLRSQVARIRLEESEEEKARRRALRELWQRIAEVRVPLSEQKRCIGEILDFMDLDCEQVDQFSTLGHTLMLIGEAGAGKSVCVDLVRELVPSNILAVRIPNQATPVRILTEMLRALGEPYADLGEFADKLSRVREALEKREIGLIIFEEIQRFIDKSKNKRVNHNATQFLQDFTEGVKIPTLLVGTPEALNVFSNGQATELERRTRHFLRLAPFSRKNSDGIHEFHLLLTALEKALELPAASNLKERAKASVILSESKGLVGLIVKLLFRAAGITINRKQPCISLEILNQAALEIKADRKLSNAT